MAIQNEIIWAEFLGNGFVAGPFVSTTVATVTSQGNDVYDVIINWADIYGDTDRMIDNIGARVYVEGFSTLNVPDGYYTIIDAIGTNTVTITGIFDPAPITGIPTTAGSITIEDFYKFSNGIPDFVTGVSAQSRWLSIISDDGISATIGQRVEPRGGVSSFDGFSITLNFVNDTELTAAGVTADTTQRINAFKRLVKSQAEFALDTASNSIALYTSIYSGDTTIAKRGTTDLLPAYKSSDASFNFVPVLIDREALLLISTSAAGAESRDIACRRGILGTGNGTFHVENSAIYSGIQTGQATLCRVRTLPVDATTYDFKFVGATNEIVDEGLLYSGIVENVKFGNRLTNVSFELSPQIYGSGKNSFSAKFGINGRITATRDELGIMYLNHLSPQPRTPFKWVKINDDVAVKLRPALPGPGGYDPDADPTISSELEPELPGSYSNQTIIDNIVWDPDNLEYNDNYVILTTSDTPDNWSEKSKTTPRVIGGTRIEEERTSFLIQDLDTGLRNRDGVVNTGVITIDPEQFIGQEAKLAHVFEPIKTIFPYSLTETAFEQPCYVSRLTLPEILLQILTSDNGDGANGPLDVLPLGMGLAVDQNDIDYDSFGYDSVNQEVNYDLATGVPKDKLEPYMRNVFVSGKDTTNIKKWMDKSLLKPFNLGLVQTSTGKVRLIDTTYLQSATLTTTLVNDDLSFDHDSRSFDFRQSYDATNLFQNIIVEMKEPSRQFNRQNRTVIVNPVEIIDDDSGEGGVAARLYSYIQAAPLKIELPFALDGGDFLLSRIVGVFSAIYSKILPTIEFAALSNRFDIGDKIAIDLDNIISPLGSRGFTGFGIVTDKKTNIFARQSRYKVIILADSLLEWLGNRVWSSSAKVDTGSTATIINVEENEFVPTAGTDISAWDNDSDGFEVGDKVLLYDENFVLLSVDGSNNAQSRTVTSTTSTTIRINSAFSDSGGTNITPAANYIIMHAAKSEQVNSITQDNLAWIKDGSTIW